MNATDYDAGTMLRAKCGDGTALDSLVRKHRAPVIHYVYGMVRDQAASEELAQEVFLRVHRNRETYQVTAKFTTWLYRIAANLALNWLRDHERDRLHEPLDASPTLRPYRQVADPNMNIDEWMILQASMQEIRQAVDELPERQRTVVLLHKFEGMACEDIAAHLQCSHQAVRSLLFRAYATLRTRLAHFQPEAAAYGRARIDPLIAGLAKTG
jgi:RNA polymerase sigma-70 factor, ECF subfamily